MPSLPSKQSIKKAFPQFSDADVAAVYNKMFAACVQLADSNLTDSDVEAIGWEVLVNFVVHLGAAHSVEDVGVFVGQPAVSVANYVDVGNDWADTIIFSREGRYFELNSWRGWVSTYCDNLRDDGQYMNEASWEASA